MLCPKCSKRPFGFLRWLGTLNPFRIECSHCLAKLRAGGFAYLWTLLHLFIGGGLIWLWGASGRSGYLDSSWAMGLFLLAAVIFIFCTAYVVPYFAFDRMYRTDAEGSPPNLD